jgi:quercetin dioxygenase-like cupin family protein
MGRVVYVDDAASEWRVSPLKPGMKEGDPRVRSKLLSSGGEGIPLVLLAEYEPGHREPRHSHANSELLYILDGEATVEGRTVRPGMLVFVEGKTEYGPITSGANGVRFLRVEV